MFRRKLSTLKRRQEYHIPITLSSLSHPRRRSNNRHYSSTSQSTTNRSNTSLIIRFQQHSPRSFNVINHARPAISRQTRALSTATFISILTPPLVLVGLTVSLWLYKCLMMIIFQNKIIYMPSMPPFSRSEKVEDYQDECRPVEWREERIQSLDGVEIALCVGCYGRAWKRGGSGNNKNKDDEKRRKQVVVLYFQGNGSSTPPRLPLLSSVLKQLYRNSAVDTDANAGTEYTIVAPSYRGFWTSRGRPSQPGIELDALASLAWVKNQFKPTATPTATNTRIVLWGQSIGAGVATGLAAANHTQARKNGNSKDDNNNGGAGDGDVSALILENPFVSVPSMLLALYPQRWLPYRYLGPFLRNWWDSEQAILSLNTTPTATTTPGAGNGGKSKVLIISSEKDELVPPDQADRLQDICASSGMDVHRCKVRGALHNDATTRAEGRNAVVEFLQEVHIHSHQR